MATLRKVTRFSLPTKFPTVLRRAPIVVKIQLADTSAKVGALPAIIAVTATPPNLSKLTGSMKSPVKQLWLHFSKRNNFVFRGIAQKSFSCSTPASPK
jgi:hypothetical protein